MTIDWFDAPTLSGTRVRLQPLLPEHAPALAAAADDPVIFRWTSAPITGVDDAVAYIEAATGDSTRVALAQFDTRTGILVGTTSLYQIAPVHRSLAIGYTWISRSVQGTGFNRESKMLLLSHAFDTLGAVRVEWHTDEFNEQSRAAITKLGARFEGLLRKHRQRADGSWRTTALFSMTDDDWPSITR
ncbi:RimJ/RimL family protein N-acetyltransferase [Rhodococcus sp. 27YEA15]|uniref:GNAT family N-acetyltransferase n=1 Tax=Rhodococcus sp. 27YEA15 TaxID=3156259 RepID=UPI003C7B0EA9